VANFLATQTDWAKGLAKESIELSIDHSLCFGLYDKDKQIGFARVVTDFWTFAYLCDVFVLPEFRGKKLGRWLVECVISHPNLQPVYRFVLATQNPIARSIYEKCEFKPISDPNKWMEKLNPGNKYRGSTVGTQNIDA